MAALDKYVILFYSRISRGETMVFSNAYRVARDAYLSFLEDNAEEKKRLFFKLIDSMETNEEIVDFSKLLKEFEEYFDKKYRMLNTDP